ncbi:MAG: AAA family ATPase [Tissierellia bacterium]|nr:AAA family ATPase [Tissierellia bacterium]
MIIKKLILSSFGKFQNKTISLTEGLNIIHGQNESGKSTVNAFINAMFYGFIKSGMRRTVYTPEYEKYFPWESDRYAGSIVFEKNDSLIRIDSVFNKSYEEFKIYDANSLKDILPELGDIGREKIVQSGRYFWGISEKTFEHTAYLAQGGIHNKEIIINEINELLTNSLKSNDENISVDTAISNLDREIKSVNSKFGIREIEKLIELQKREFKELKNIDTIYENNLEKLIDLEKNIDLAKTKRDEISKDFESLKAYESKRLYDKALDRQKYLDNINSELENYEEFKNIDNLTYKDLTVKLQQYKKTKEHLNSDNEALNELELEIDKLNLENSNFKNYSEIEEDYNFLQELKTRIKRLSFKAEDIAQNILQNDKKIKFRKLKQSVLISILLSIFMILATHFLNNKFLFGLILPVLIIIVALYTYNKKPNFEEYRDYENIKLNLDKLLQNKSELERYYINTYNKNIIDLYDEHSDKFLKYRDNLAVINNLKSKVEKVKATKNINEVNFKQIENAIRTELTKNNIYNYENIEDLIEKLDQFYQLNTEKKNLEEYLQILLKNRSFANLQLYKDITVPRDLKDSKTLIEESKNIDRELKVLNDEYLKIKTANSFIEKDIKRKQKLEEKLDLLLAKEAEYNDEMFILKEAKKAIIESSKGLHSNYRNLLNSKLSENLSLITNGKYQKSYQDENFEVHVYDSALERYVNISDLSFGTIDQVYLALRIAILQISNLDSPLFLDEVFSNYDDERFGQAINFLNTLQNTRQIILYSCNTREIDFIKNNNIKANIIYL